MRATIRHDPQRLHELFSYDGETGLLTHKQGRRKGKHACYFDRGRGGTGYYTVSINGRNAYAHRVIFAMCHGRWPEMDIDHIDGDSTNNRIENLREVPRQVNLQNRRSAKDGTSTGLLGASRARSGRFIARIRVGPAESSKAVYLGTFDTPHEAHEAYVSAKRLLHVGCTL